MEELGGINLYVYVSNWTGNESDFLGLSPACRSDYDFDEKRTEFADTWIGISGTRFTKKHGITYTPVDAANACCACGNEGKWYPRFTFKVSTQSFILSKNHPEWDGPHSFDDHEVTETFRSSNWRWYRRLFVRLHEAKHRRHARSNYEKAVETLRPYEDYGYFSQSVCEDTADDLVNGEKERFYNLEIGDAHGVDHNPG
jgi:hypothetical protein